MFDIFSVQASLFSLSQSNIFFKSFYREKEKESNHKLILYYLQNQLYTVYGCINYVESVLIAQ